MVKVNALNMFINIKFKFKTTKDKTIISQIEWCFVWTMSPLEHKTILINTYDKDLFRPTIWIKSIMILGFNLIKTYVH